MNPALSDSNETYQNTPNASLMYAMYTPTFGNGSFQIQPPQPGVMGKSFPTVPYFSIEAIIYQQQSANPLISPVNIMSGQHIGQQNTQGIQTVPDNFNTSRYQLGFQQQ
jgi:hypothetical protein